MLDRDLAEEVLRAARRHGGGFAEIFVEERTRHRIRLDDGKVEELTTGLDRGAGIRVGRGDDLATASRYTNRLDRDALLEAAEAAAALCAKRAGRRRRPAGARAARHPPGARPADVAAADKVAWVAEADDAARAFSPEVVQVVAVTAIRCSGC